MDMIIISYPSCYLFSDWRRQAYTAGAIWYEFYDDWLSQKKPLLVITYENLVKDIKGHMERILQFLNIKVNPKSFNCMLKNAEGIYHRKPKQLEYDIYNAKQTGLMNTYIGFINEVLKSKSLNLTVDDSIPRGVKKIQED